MYLDEFFITNKEKTVIYHIRLNDYINWEGLQAELRSQKITDIEDIVNYIDNIPICECIHLMDQWNTLEVQT